MAVKLELSGINCGYSDRTIIKGVSMTIEAGEVMCLLGPNGSGKSTLFKSILGLLPLQGGKILVDGNNISSWSRPKLARVMGYIPQDHIPSFPYTVLDIVLMGRVAHLNRFSSPSAGDVKVAEEALETLNISYLRDKLYTEISGGERQLVVIARALAQQPQILIMDEPTSNLDFGNQMLVLKKIQRLSQLNLAVIMSSHFPNHALLCATKVMLLKDGMVFSMGTPEETVTERNLKMIYGVDVKIVKASMGNGEYVKVCVPEALRELSPRSDHQSDELGVGYELAVGG
jgi:ABC-type cobalamin/Fe3+-siderophores transport system ATPase subunit